MSALKLTLVQRIELTIGLLLGLMLVAGGFTAWSVYGIHQQARQTVESDLVQLLRMSNMQKSVSQARRAEKDVSIDLLMKMDRVPQRIAEWKQHVDEAKALMRTVREAEFHPQVLDSIQQGAREFEAYTSRLSGILARIESKEILDQAVYEEEIQAHLRSAVAAEAQIGQAMLHTSELTTRGGEQVSAAVRQLFWIVGLGLTVAMVFGLLLGQSLLRGIRRPLAHLTRGIASVRAGNLSQEVPVYSSDELGQMAGDFNTMVASLRAMVQEVRQGAEGVTEASSQIASGNNDLSSRTEQAAASLQQAAASLDTLTSTVRKTADSAHAANGIASSAASSAGQCGDLVQQVVLSMAGIQTSSSRIADITAVIDGIAFQTNILALNAAVEAARAGEQGRGFAVVAGEVRLLAQRSAEAAREIKALIEASRDEVESGSRLVQEAGSAMSQIVRQVAEVSHVIQAITQDARIQLSEIGGVNQSMGQLEQMTQQNAALVEQAAAASSSLRDQADRMADVMRMFTVGREHQLLLAA